MIYFNFYYRYSCFGRRYHQLSPGDLLGTPNVIGILTPLRIVHVVPQYRDQTKFSADGTKAFEIGFYALISVFGDESVMEDSEV